MKTDRRALDCLAERFARAWNERDADALCSLYAEEADAIDVNGNMWHGREAIAAEHRRLFGGAFAHSMLRLRTVKVSVANRATAIIYAVWSMTGQTASRARDLPVRTGVWLFVAVRRTGEWRVVASHAIEIPGQEP